MFDCTGSIAVEKYRAVKQYVCVCFYNVSARNGFILVSDGLCLLITTVAPFCPVPVSRSQSVFAYKCKSMEIKSVELLDLTNNPFFFCCDSYNYNTAALLFPSNCILLWHITLMSTLIWNRQTLLSECITFANKQSLPVFESKEEINE